MTEVRPYRVFMCDDVADLRLLVRMAVADDPQLEVVGEAQDGRQCIAGIAEAAPDVILLDLSMPGLDGLEVIEQVRKAAPNAGIVIFSGFAADRMKAVALELGADRYLEKGQSLAVVRSTLFEVASARREAAA